MPASNCNIFGYNITKVLIGKYIGDELQLLIIGTNCRFFKMGRIDAWDELSFFGIWDELSLGTNCRLGRIVAWDELSLGTNCRLGRIVAWDELSLGTNCRLGRIVAWDELSLGTNCRFTPPTSRSVLSITLAVRFGNLSSKRDFFLPLLSGGG